MLKMEGCPTKEMKADIFTKAFPNGREWGNACELIGIHIPDEVLKSAGSGDFSLNKIEEKMANLSLVASFAGDGKDIYRAKVNRGCCTLCCSKLRQR